MSKKALRDGSYVACTRCFFCGESSAIILHKSFGDVSAYHDKVCDMTPCAKCADFMKQGIILIGIDAEKSTPGWNTPPARGSADFRENWIPNPHRSGAFCVIREDALDHIFNNPEYNAWAKRTRWIFVEHDVLVQIGAVKSS